MRQLSNAHTHSSWCDGADSPRQLVEEAIRLGFTDLGFTSHSPAPFDPGCAGLADEAAYRAEIRALREEYKDKISLLCGIEWDIRSALDDPAAYDYIIGSAHYLPLEQEWPVSVDNTPEASLRARDEYYGGDGFAMARAYYDTVVKAITGMKPQIIAHFDLVTKFNESHRLFDEESPAYQSVALEALDAVLDVAAGNGGMLEVNTGAMARGWKKTPYPALFLLRHAAKRGARVIITTDCHNKSMLGHGFGLSLELLRQAGFGSMAVLSRGEFTDVTI